MPDSLSFTVPFAHEVLGSMITPAVLISACGTLTLSTTNRLGRVVDRVRSIARDVDNLHVEASVPENEIAEKRELFNDQLTRLVRRIRLLQTALTAIHTAIVFLVGSSLAIGLKSATQLFPESVPVLLGLAGATSLLTATVFLVLEARTAIRATLLEMNYVRRVVARKTGVPPP